MIREEFLEIIEAEIAYYGKRWFGDTEEERAKSQAEVLRKYFNALKGYTAPQLRAAFQKYSLEGKHFPKIADLLKFLPKSTPAATTPDLPAEAVPMSPEVKAAINTKKRGLAALSQTIYDEMKRATRARWPNTDWTETFQRWDERRARGQ